MIDGSTNFVRQSPHGFLSITEGKKKANDTVVCPHTLHS
jgi:hypothetical protein